MSNGDQPPGPNDTIMRPGWVNPSGRPVGPRQAAPSNPEPTMMGKMGGAQSEQAFAPAQSHRADLPAQQVSSLVDNERLDFDSLRGSSEGIGPMLAFLLFASRLRSSAAVSDPEALRAKVEAALRKASMDLPKLGWDPRYVELGRYFICCAIDEAAQNAPWGRAWAARPLTATMSKNAVGGEKFFSQVDAMLRQPSIFETRLFEVAYGCLLSGFRGQYALQAGGEQQLEVYRESLLEAIKQKEENSGGRLFELAIPANRPPVAAASVLPLWVPIAIGFSLLTVAFVGYRWLLGERTSAVLTRMSALAAIEVPLPVMPVAPRRAAIDPSLLERIRSTARAAGWTVEEQPGMISVAVSGGSSFPSGSDQLDSEATTPIFEIADAMAKLKARVAVRGHSDAQPIRTFQFQNNIELSRARAVAVANVVRSSAGREPVVEGLGEQSPVCAEKSPECFSRNRRVVIVARYEGLTDAN